MLLRSEFSGTGNSVKGEKDRLGEKLLVPVSFSQFGMAVRDDRRDKPKPCEGCEKPTVWRVLRDAPDSRYPCCLPCQLG